MAHSPRATSGVASRPSRRTFLASSAAVVLGSAGLQASTGKVPKPIHAFCIDFNWRRPRSTGWINDFAKPGLWANASPKEHVDWYAGLGINAIQTFCVSCNGWAWYKGGFVPPQPGLEHDFLPEVVNLGHKKNMLVLGYVCAGANTKWGQDHPALSYGTPSDLHIPFTDEYLDYFCRSIADAVKKTGIDGYMIDWVWNPTDKLRELGWIDSEKKLFSKLMNQPFPASGKPSPQDELAYKRKAIERCWSRVHQATKDANRNCIIWLSCSELSNPTVANSKMLQEVDWVLNEGPDEKYYKAATAMVGPQTRLLQGLVGWPTHDARAFLSGPRAKDTDLYGFAEPGDNSLPKPIAEYLKRPLADFKGKDAKEANDRNIAAFARFLNGVPFDSTR
jgi:hypothetical protein